MGGKEGRERGKEESQKGRKMGGRKEKVRQGSLGNRREGKGGEWRGWKKTRSHY